jgi:murein DD-endopeptidase MepM/ murein hydrolase activator NlpD
MIYPVYNPKITSPYGVERTLPNGKKDIHIGIDFIDTEGDTHVIAPEDGVCIYDFDYYDHRLRYTDAKHSGGNYIILQHKIDDKIYFTRYMHLAVNYVSLNQPVTKGQKIGHYGDVGFGWGAHLHFELREHPSWKPIDPLPFLEA